MSHLILIALFFALFFLALLLMIEAGKYLRIRHKKHEDAAEHAVFGVVEAALFSLMGLILAFSFSGAAVRFDARKSMIVQEANDMGTAYLRLDLLPVQAQAEVREMFRKYVDARLEVYRALPDIQKAEAKMTRATELQRVLWGKAVVAAQVTPQATMLLLPALNAMFDIATTRYMASKMHPPAIIFFLMGSLTLVCALLVGFDMGASKARSWIHVIGFSVLVAITVYAILDLEYPRLGLIQEIAFDQAIVDARNAMK
jgi:hypothetical protein